MSICHAPSINDPFSAFSIFWLLYISFSICPGVVVLASSPMQTMTEAGVPTEAEATPLVVLCVCVRVCVCPTLLPGTADRHHSLPNKDRDGTVVICRDIWTGRFLDVLALNDLYNILALTLFLTFPFAQSTF